MKKYYYTIGEVSNLLGLKPYVIRYWETEFSVLKPRKDEGRIRKYSEENVLMLQRIKDMLHNQRFTIEGARQKLKQERAAERYAKKQLPTPEQQVPENIKESISEVRSGLVEILHKCQKLKRKNT